MKIIIIGSGIAGITFAEKFQSLSSDAKITILTKETDGYYSRPMLSKGFSQNDIEQSIIIKTFSELLNNRICIINGVEVTQINRHQKNINIQGFDEVETLEYDILILAMGSAAFIPPPLLPYQNCFHLFNSLYDLKQLRLLRHSLLSKSTHPHWAIIGGGLIGCEVASDLALANDQVSIFHVMDRLMERQLEKDDSDTLLNVLQSSGVNIHLNQAISGLDKTDGKVQIKVGKEQHVFDSIILACGFKPRTELATKAGLITERGIKTNQYLQTNDDCIYAIGDIAQLPNGKLYAFIKPIYHQALWLAHYLSKQEKQAWCPPDFSPTAKVNHFEAKHPYLF